jgi:hypothetical protein
MNYYSKTISLFSQPYLDLRNQCYKNIVVVNLPPQGPLGKFIRQIRFPPLSEFQEPGPCSPIKKCGLALMSLEPSSSCCDNLMVVNDIPNLMSFLLSNGYSIDTSVTKMFNNSDITFNTNTGSRLICFITYNG